MMNEVERTRDAAQGATRALNEMRAAAAEAGSAARKSMAPASQALKQVGEQVKSLSDQMVRGLGSAFEGAIFDGERLSNSLRALALDLSRTAFRAAMAPLQNQLGGLVGGAVSGLFADGAAFSSGQVRKFARGGVVSAPTAFPMRGGVGVMGEAGPEAIMPLARGPDGKLGVRGAGGGGQSITINIATPDVDGFRRSSGQIAAQIARAAARGSARL